jgi:hypothetical protein
MSFPLTSQILLSTSRLRGLRGTIGEIAPAFKFEGERRYPDESLCAASVYLAFISAETSR